MFLRKNMAKPSCKAIQLLLGLLRSRGTSEPFTGEKVITRWMVFISSFLD